MKTKNIHIENLEIRLPKNYSSSAREIASGLGDEILRNVAENKNMSDGRIENLDAGKINISGRISAKILTTEIASRVGTIIENGTNRGEK